MLSHYKPGEQMRQPQNRSPRPGSTLARVGALTAVLALAMVGPPALVATALPPSIVSAVSPDPAYAGTWAQATCALPTPPTSVPAPIEGWTSATSGGQATNACNPSAGGLIVSALSAGALPPLAGAIYTYTAPPGSTIAGGTLALTLFAPAGLAYVATPAATYDPADVIAACQSGFVCGTQVNGGLTEVIPITHPGGTQLFAVAECLEPGGGNCPASGGGAFLDAEVNIFAAIIDLTNNATPAASGFGGALLAPGPVSGTQPINFTATDTGGPGVYQLAVTVDGKSVYSGTPDTNDGHCVSAGPDAAGHNTFLYAAPCKATVAASVPVDTTTLSDGTHDLVVTVIDAAGNSSLVLHQPIVAANRTKVSADLSRPLPPAAPPVTAPAPAPVANGGGACAAAHLTAAFAGAAVAHVSLGHGATLQGSLSCAGQPIGAAAIEVAVTRRGDRAPPATTELHTGTDGSFSYVLGPGPSRDLTLSYRAFSSDAAPAATATARLEVRPSIRLSIVPPRVRNGQTITYRGQVSGGFIPASGLPLDVQFRDGTRWRTFDQTRAAARDGRFVFHYTFRRTTQPIVYDFRVSVPSTGVAGYPYAPTASRPRAVRVDP